jgi:hypothetical protein
MILLYTSLLLLLGIVKFLVGLRARALERKYSRLAEEVGQLVRQPDYKAGNSNNVRDPCQSAKRAYLLGQFVQQRDRAEAKHFAWQHRAERLSRWVRALREWKGAKLPYTLGAVDLWMLLHMIDYVGVGEYLSTGNVVQTVTSLFTQ